MQSILDDRLGRPRLNFDVLRLLCSYLTDVSDVISFSLTCSSLTEDALRRRLRMSPVNLWNGEIVGSFHAFILSNRPSRAPCIYGLKIGTGSFYDLKFENDSDLEVVQKHLVDILEEAVQIQYLELKSSVGGSVVDAMVKLATVRELHIFTDMPMDQGSLLMGLTTFRSPLRFLRLFGSELAGSNFSATFLHDRLSYLAPTLEFLDLDSFPIDAVPSSLTTQFTTVRSLKLHTTFLPDCDLLGVLLRLFPKLDDKLELGSLSPYIREDYAPVFRERCEAAQKQHCWSKLDRLVCDAFTAYLLALLCPILRMDIEVHHWPGATAYLTETLRHHCPPHLYVHMTLLDGFGALDGMFPPEATNRLTHLVVFACIELRHGRRPSDLSYRDRVRANRFVNRLLSSIQHLRLTHIRVVFRYSIYQSARKAVPHEDDATDHTRDIMDLQAAKARFVDALPTLRYLFLTSCGNTHIISSRKMAFRTETLNRWLSSKAWCVVPGHDTRAGEDIRVHLRPTNVSTLGAQCVELSEEIGDMIAVEEDMLLSRREEENLKAWKCGSSE